MGFSDYEKNKIRVIVEGGLLVDRTQAVQTGRSSSSAPNPSSLPRSEPLKDLFQCECGLVTSICAHRNHEWKCASCRQTWVTESGRTSKLAPNSLQNIAATNPGPGYSSPPRVVARARPTPLSEAARQARAPRPPEELVAARQDRVHIETGKLIAAVPLKGILPAVDKAPLSSTDMAMSAQDAFYTGVYRVPKPQALQHLDPLHRIICVSCGGVISSGDKNHHVLGEHIYDCQKCDSKKAIVDCPTDCVGWGLNGTAVVTTVPRRAMQSVIDAKLRETWSASEQPFFYQRPSIVEALIDTSKEFFRRTGVYLASVKLHPSTFQDLEFELGPRVQYCYGEPRGDGLFYRGIVLCDLKVLPDEPFYPSLAAPKKPAPSLVYELFTDVVWDEAKSKAEIPAGVTDFSRTSDARRRVDKVISVMWARPEHADVRKLAEEKAARIEARR
jgi:hypothetical protein